MHLLILNSSATSHTSISKATEQLQFSAIAGLLDHISCWVFHLIARSGVLFTNQHTIITTLAHLSPSSQTFESKEWALPQWNTTHEFCNSIQLWWVDIGTVFHYVFNCVKFENFNPFSVHKHMKFLPMCSSIIALPDANRPTTSLMYLRRQTQSFINQGQCILTTTLRQDMRGFP